MAPFQMTHCVTFRDHAPPCCIQILVRFDQSEYELLRGSANSKPYNWITRNVSNEASVNDHVTYWAWFKVCILFESTILLCGVMMGFRSVAAGLWLFHCLFVVCASEYCVWFWSWSYFLSRNSAKLLLVFCRSEKQK